jgi:hypothetical protein
MLLYLYIHLRQHFIYTVLSTCDNIIAVAFFDLSVTFVVDPTESQSPRSSIHYVEYEGVDGGTLRWMSLANTWS